ncbi:hypothetical protein MTYP_02666 [Methylophilaceae bacterium]|nr:hypothetical protein MTYP_02666 [Methylophilaceae bacterium]
MSGFVPEEFFYRLNWRARGAQPGSHATRTPGGSMDFRGYVPFLESPDPRRIDLRAGLRSVPRKLMVRAFYERGAVNVYAIVDASASMRFTGAGEKHRLAADIAASIAWSATRNGDNFALVVCDDKARADMFSAPSHRRNLAEDIRARCLQGSFYEGAGASALPLAVEHLRQKRSLVFLISDFHLEEKLLRKTLLSLTQHDVVPLVLWDSAEYRDIPAWGWARVRDMESGGSRSLFMRPSLALRIKASYAERRAGIVAMCRQAGARTPFFVEDRFCVEHLTRHLLEAC